MKSPVIAIAMFLNHMLCARRLDELTMLKVVTESNFEIFRGPEIERYHFVREE